MDSPVSRVTRSKESARLSYNRMSGWYDLLTGHTERKYRERGLDKLSAQAGEKILEIGFGTGHGLVSLAKAVGREGRIYGVDISDGMLAIARKRLQKNGLEDRVELHLGDAARLDFLKSNSLGRIFMSFTLELFDTPDIACVLDECHRVLEPDGPLVIVSMARIDPPGLAVRVYEWFHEHLPDYADCRPILARRSAQRSGFEVENSDVLSMWGLPVEIILARKHPLDGSG